MNLNIFDTREFCFDANFDVPFFCDCIDFPFPMDIWPREIKNLTEKWNITICFNKIRERQKIQNHQILLF